MSRWGYRWPRPRINLGPFARLNFSRSGISLTAHFKRLISWNSRTHDLNIDSPGPGGIVRRGRRKRKG